jgi:hypothetical protein
LSSIKDYISEAKIIYKISDNADEIKEKLKIAIKK